MTRPTLRWHGGKFRLRHWVIGHFPKHETYVEVFGGAGSALLEKAPSKIEVYNDTNNDVVDFFKTLRDPELSTRLQEQLRLTPYSRAEHGRAYDQSDDPVERARRFVVRSFQGIGAKASKEKTGWRTRTSKCNGSYNTSWKSYADCLPEFTARLMDVIIENSDWRKILDIYDSPETLFYMDPPYPFATRSSAYRKTYGVEHELTDDDHKELCQAALTLQGKVILSSYQNPIYDEILEGWQVVKTDSRAQCNLPRVEALYISPRAQIGDLFMEVA